MHDLLDKKNLIHNDKNIGSKESIQWGIQHKNQWKNVDSGKAIGGIVAKVKISPVIARISSGVMVYVLKRGATNKFRHETTRFVWDMLKYCVFIENTQDWPTTLVRRYFSAVGSSLTPYMLAKTYEEYGCVQEGHHYCKYLR